jgi:hypothetical protein
MAEGPYCKENFKIGLFRKINPNQRVKKIKDEINIKKFLIKRERLLNPKSKEKLVYEID